jgi:hypothetical protein
MNSEFLRYYSGLLTLGKVYTGVKFIRESGRLKTYDLAQVLQCDNELVHDFLLRILGAAISLFPFYT